MSLSFNEAPIHESGKFDVFDLRNVVYAASMRPRFMNRGSERSHTNPYPDRELQ